MSSHRFNPETILKRSINRHIDADTSALTIPSAGVYYAQVLNIDDEKNSKRIQVRIPGIDNPNTPLELLPWCMATTPPFLFYLPMVGEMVMVHITSLVNNTIGRLYYGPIMTDNFTDGQTYEDTMNKFGFIKKTTTAERR